MRHTWLRRGLLTASTAALVVTAAPAAHATAATTLSVGPYRVTKTVGSGVTFSFTLVSGSKHLGSKPVDIYTRPTTTTTWTKSWHRTLDAQGHVSVAFTVQRSTYVMAKFLGDTTYAASHSGGALVTAAQPLGTRAVGEASKHNGQPYVSGAEGPDRFDCSGLTRYVFGRFGKSLPHNSGQQYGTVKHIAQSARQVGDLIFIHTSSGSIYHVGIYAGDGYFWHSPKPGDHVKKAPIWTSSYYVGRVG